MIPSLYYVDNVTIHVMYREHEFSYMRGAFHGSSLKLYKFKVVTYMCLCVVCMVWLYVFSWDLRTI